MTMPRTFCCRKPANLFPKQQAVPKQAGSKHKPTANGMAPLLFYGLYVY